MSRRTVHIQQAHHNEAMAHELISSGYRYRDWTIIAAFYAALHYLEARLHDDPPFSIPQLGLPIFHTDDIVRQPNIPVRLSPHGWRNILLESNCDVNTGDAYRNLRQASEMARYHQRIEPRTTAHDFFGRQAVDYYIDCLESVKIGLEII